MSDSNTAPKYKFYRKPSIKKAPEIKHTKTSMQRILEANPLLKMGIDVPKTVTNGTSKVKPEEKSQFSRIDSMRRSKSQKNPAFNYLPSKLISGNGPNLQINSSAISTGPSIDFNSCSQILSSTVIDKSFQTKKEPATFKKSITVIDNKIIESTEPLANSETANNRNQEKGTRRPLLRDDKRLIRRSLSAQYHEKKQGTLMESEPLLDSQNRTQSVDRIASIIPVIQPTTPILANNHDLIFKTPSAYERRSVSRFSSCSRRSIYRPSTPLPSLDDLERRLNSWLIKRGKNVAKFTRLKSFTLENVLDDNKENINVNGSTFRGSYEDLQIPKVTVEENKGTDNIDIDKIAKEALSDLLVLIQEGYPISHCEEWLSLIKIKYKNLQQEPEYWECRAAIEECRGNIGNAVDCYKAAIVRGAEVSEVDKSLDKLLQKFSLLNISPTIVQNDKMSRERARIIQDARNVFKSSVIKIAVAAKKMKEDDNQLKLVATPVRRSSRLFHNSQNSTPGVKLYSNLREVDQSDREVVFHPNKAFD